MMTMLQINRFAFVRQATTSEAKRKCSGLAVVSHQAGLKNVPANEGVNSLMREFCLDDAKREPRSCCLRMDQREADVKLIGEMRDPRLG
jgi:hypothetical protein